MTEAEMMQDLSAADAAGDTELAQRIAGKIKAARGQTIAPAQSGTPRQKMAGALNKLLPGVPESSEQAIGMGMGMTMPNPLPFVGQFLKGSARVAAEGVKRVAGSMFPKAMEAGGAALDPVLQQAPRNPLPALPKILEHVPGIGTPTKIYNTIRGAAESLPREVPANPYPAGPPSNPYPSEGPVVPYRRPPPSVLPQATKQTDPALQAAAEASRARVMANAERMRMAPEAPPPTPAATPATPTPTATTQEPAAVLNPFESAARAKKVSELVKAIDANAGVHLGVDPRDPRFAAALADLPQQWWDGMAQVTKINKPSQETINQALEFFRDRAAQGAQKLAQ